MNNKFIYLSNNNIRVIGAKCIDESPSKVIITEENRFKFWVIFKYNLLMLKIKNYY